MRKELTDLTVVLDSSGSMASCRGQAEQGLNELIRQQRDFGVDDALGNSHRRIVIPSDVQPECTFTLVQFNTGYQFVHNGIPIQDVPHCRIIPDGGTALLDAVRHAINETGNRLRDMPEEQRPGLVVFVIITDGEENSSRQFTKTQIKDMIEHQQSVYKWQFTFLGANQDAFAEAGAIGITLDATLNYNAEEKTCGSFALASNKVGTMRGLVYTGEQASWSYSSEERDSVK